MDRCIVVDFHGGSRGFECVPGFLLSVLLIGVISGLLMDLDRRRFYGNAWNYGCIKVVEWSYLSGSLRLGAVWVAGSW